MTGRRWREPGHGSRPAALRYSIGFDQDTVDDIRERALLEHVSFSEKVRQLVEWGLEADKEEQPGAPARSQNR